MQISGSNLLTHAVGARALQGFSARNSSKQPKIDTTHQQQQSANFERLRAFAYSNAAKDAMSQYKAHSTNPDDEVTEAEVVGIDIYV